MIRKPGRIVRKPKTPGRKSETIIRKRSAAFRKIKIPFRTPDDTARLSLRQYFDAPRALKSFTVIEQNEREIATGLKRSEALRQSILKKAFSGLLVAQDPADEPAAVLPERVRKEREGLGRSDRFVKSGRSDRSLSRSGGSVRFAGPDGSPKQQQKP